MLTKSRQVQKAGLSIRFIFSYCLIIYCLFTIDNLWFVSCRIYHKIIKYFCSIFSKPSSISLYKKCSWTIQLQLPSDGDSKLAAYLIVDGVVRLDSLRDNLAKTWLHICCECIITLNIIVLLINCSGNHWAEYFSISVFCFHCWHF